MIIRIKNLVVNTILGVYDWEKTQPRQVIYNIQIKFDESKVLQSQAIADTVDYDALVDQITQFTEGSRFELIETLANEVLKIIMAHPLVIKAKVEVEKPGAVAAADSISIECKAEK